MPLRIKANSVYNQYTCLEKDYLPHRRFVNSHTKTYSSHNNWNFSIHPLLLDLISFSWFQTCVKHLHYNLCQCQRSCFIETYSGNFRNKKESELKWKMGKQTHAMLHWLHPSRALLTKGWRIIQQINDYPTDELVLTKHTALSTYQRFIHILILVNYQWNLMKFWW